MRTLKSSGLLVLAAVTALVGSSLPMIGAMPGQASLSSTVSAAPAATASAGTLTLRTTSSAGIVEWAGQTQTFREKTQCQIIQDPGQPDLLTLEGRVGGAAGTAGFRNGDIGVYEFDAEGNGADNAAQCFRVDADSFIGDETLVLRLGQDAVDEFGDLVATTVTIAAFRNSKSGAVSVDLVRSDGTVVDGSPVSWNGGKPGSQIPTPTYTGAFTEIRLTADSGSFSLRGAQFALASEADAVFCADGQAGDTFTNDAGVKVTYLGDVSSAGCDPFGIRLTGDEDAKVWFIKPLDVNPNAQFIFEVPWDTVGWPALTPGSELPQALIDFEESVPPNEIEMPYCPDFLFDGTGALVGLGANPNPADVAALEALDMIPDVTGDLRTDGTQFACIGDRSGSVEKSVGADGYDVGLTDLIYLIGDARMSLK
ncbi:hypothetical protein GA707_16695 [Nostocoides sp. F2B08]|uniref:hypothetical protein n=1 Tax=Nostocoides sp. F2B08 TaxID=2653936 RepID=UPI001263BA43|nr:hypothetical protein [Tetrasphaera sp. F2B08]KAB7741853.1 hypothetical protein GA707_16695 [Tetrasphaera sp. F2B08]